MTHTTPYLRYLSIPPDYDPAFELRWSKSGDAIETRDGKTFVVTAALAQFLEGFAAQRPLIHIVYVLDLLRLLGHSDTFLQGLSVRENNRIREAFRKQGTPLRNAGALFGLVCADIPNAYLPGYNDRDLAHWCATQPTLPVAGWKNSEEPPFEAATFRQLLHVSLANYNDDEIKHWFRFGRSRVSDGGKRLADEVINAKPPAVHGTFEEQFRQRPRLAGALPMVGTMVSALSMPPRRRSPPELPLGGYADVTTRGEPERLLPSQFALDDDEFVRRFAEKELLFFRREEPHQRTREQLVLLVDQGVRTWGVVRLALVAAVIAFRKLAERRKLPFFIRFNGKQETIDPLECDPSELLDRLESSDLSANPFGMLDAISADENTENADYVLLTHPRSLIDAEVKQSAAEIPANRRLFALAVDEEGAAQFNLLSHGEPISISRFRVEFRAVEDVPVILPAGDQPSTGPVEPVPFAFANAPLQKIVAVGFDADSRYLVAVTSKGFIHAWNLESGKCEILPRALLDNGRPVSVAQCILSTHGGIVLAVANTANQLIAAHYDIERRRVRTHRIDGIGGISALCYSFPQHNSIAVRNNTKCYGLDLGSGVTHCEIDKRSPHSRLAFLAFGNARSCKMPPPQVPVLTEGTRLDPTPYPHLFHDPNDGTLQVRSGMSTSKTISIKSDGKNLFEKTIIQQALFAENTLAVRTNSRNTGDCWYLIDVEEPSNIIELNKGPKYDQISALSLDGRCFAHLRQSGRVAVHRCVQGGPPALVTGPGLQHNLAVHLGRTSMYIHVGSKNRHFLSWSDGCLKHHFERQQRQSKPAGHWVADQRGQAHPLAKYDPDRFVSVASNTIDVLIDVTGQVIIYDPNRQRLICIFKVRKKSLAVWMPDGTWYGPADMIGGPATPDALQRIGTALRQASAAEE